MTRIMRRVVRTAVMWGVSVLLMNAADAKAQVIRIAENASHPVLSWDGRFVAFESTASDLVPGDNNRDRDVFVRDRLTNTTTRVSVSTEGTEPNGDSFLVGVSSRGQIVAFTSSATNLVLHPVPPFRNLFIHDLTTGVTRYVPTGSPGSIALGFTLSPNGRYIAFLSNAPDVVPGDTNRTADVFIHDLQAGTTRRVVERPNDFGVGVDFSFSYDGRYLASVLTSAVDPRDTVRNCFLDHVGTINCPDIYVLDQLTGSIELIGLTPADIVSNWGASQPSLSADGRFVAFASSSSDFDGTGPASPGGLHPYRGRLSQSVFVYDRLLKTTTRLTPVPLTTAAWHLDDLGISADGRAVTFTFTSDFTAGGNPGLHNVYVVNRESGQLRAISVTTGGDLAFGGESAISGDGGIVAFSSSAADLVAGDAGGVSDVFLAAAHDLDADTLPDDWEQRFGLSVLVSTGVDGATGDPDGDGLTNEQELLLQSHPANDRSATRYFAEGATGFFETRISVANAGATSASVLLRFVRGDGSIMSHPLTVPAQQSRKVAVSTLPGMNGGDFATIIESDQLVVVDRQMWWDVNAYGTHAETGVVSPALTWYFAEGATHGGFDLFYLLHNPGDMDADVRVRYLLPSGDPLEQTYAVPAHSRFNVWADVEEFPNGSGNLALASTDVAAVIEVTNGVPIIVERAMYLSAPGSVFQAGHESAGVTAPALQWFFAEGATGPFFDCFVLLANPSTTAPAQVRATYLLPTGQTLTKDYFVPANSRVNVWLDLEMFPDGNGGKVAALADAAVSTTLDVLNGVPIVAERTMWFPGSTAATWAEAHNAFGSTETATLWGFAEGIVLGPPTNTETFFLIANTGTTLGRVRVTLLFDDGGAALAKEYDLLPQSRFNVAVRQEFPETFGRGFGAVIESLGPSAVPIVVERAMYNDAQGTVWAAGSDALGTRLQ
jgi:Tol biopolymer transport system component